ncbi:MAG: hypothetical protein HY704_08920 [Gemmatimonadetes bacterium]|nr:hypothetical protein [Gemmatimonadota bacterium]
MVPALLRAPQLHGPRSPDLPAAAVAALADGSVISSADGGHGHGALGHFDALGQSPTPCGTGFRVGSETARQGVPRAKSSVAASRVNPSRIRILRLEHREFAATDHAARSGRLTARSTAPPVL